jgi:hypothetical protein
MQIEIDFDVFKALTARRATEAVSYNQVIRELLGLPAESSRDDVAESSPDVGGNYIAAGRSLPVGTKLRAVYKGKIYRADIRNGRVYDEHGEAHASLSAAARSITKNNVNGMRFWKAKRPGDQDWLIVAGLPSRSAE